MAPELDARLRSKAAHVFYAAGLAVLALLAASGATGRVGAVIMVISVGFALYVLHRRFNAGKTVFDSWP